MAFIGAMPGPPPVLAGAAEAAAPVALNVGAVVPVGEPAAQLAGTDNPPIRPTPPNRKSVV